MTKTLQVIEELRGKTRGFSGQSGILIFFYSLVLRQALGIRSRDSNMGFNKDDNIL
jgi:hypothetical protein